MSNLPSLVKKPELFRLQWTSADGYDKDRYIDSLPYKISPEYLFQIVSEKGIKVPFDIIISKDMGFSECRHCGAKYSGNQEICTAIVAYYRINGGWSWIRGEYPDYDYDRKTKQWKNKDSVCESTLKWDLQEKFDEQSSFFSFVEFMGNIPTDAMNLISKYSSLLPPGSSSEYRLIYAEKQLTDLNIKMDNVFSALNEIANRMSSAGQMLSFRNML